MRKFIILSLAATISACASDPEVVNVSHGNEQNLSCQELSQEYSRANAAYQAADGEDRFQFKDIFPPTGFTSMYNINKARNAATSRMSLIENISRQKNCPSPTSVTYPQ